MNKANLEKTVAGVLSSYGYRKLDNLERDLLRSDIRAGKDPIKTMTRFGSPVFVKQIKGYKTVYGISDNHDILAWHPVNFSDGLIINIKWQSANESIDEILPTRQHQLSKLKGTGILVIDGEGNRPNGLNWMESKNEKNVFLGLGSFNAFTSWAMHNL